MTGSEIDIEQKYVTVLYACVDAMREEAAARLAAARHAGGDAVVVWRAEVTRLDAVEQGLCFGRLDMRDGRRVYLGRLGLFRDEDDEPNVGRELPVRERAAPVLPPAARSASSRTSRP